MRYGVGVLWQSDSKRSRIKNTMQIFLQKKKRRNGRGIYDIRGTGNWKKRCH